MQRRRIALRTAPDSSCNSDAVAGRSLGCSATSALRSMSSALGRCPERSSQSGNGEGLRTATSLFSVATAFRLTRPR